VTASPFVFVACRAGSEPALKRELAALKPDWRFAFSRPGFVTFRRPDAGAEPDLHSVFARTWGRSLGKAVDADPQALARAFWTTVGDLAAEPRAARHLHLWRRAAALPGDEDYDVGALAEIAAVGANVLALRPEGVQALALNEHALPGERVLDCVLVEPHEWWFGTHIAGSPETRWPGGVPNLAAPASMVSRAYLKLAEALLWSGLPIAPGDRCVEIGSAPGGSCQLLLERGCEVTGVDPAEMDARVLAHPRFTHVRARAKDLKRAAFEPFRWLTCDANVAPKYTLDTVEPIVTWPRSRIEGVVLTLKLTDEKLAASLAAFVERIRSWAFADVRLRQLAFNRREVCAVATRR
jgi:23S rRNA (cytidine2498-2'-O)-methyltransferase